MKVTESHHEGGYKISKRNLGHNLHGSGNLMMHMCPIQKMIEMAGLRGETDADDLDVENMMSLATSR